MDMKYVAYYRVSTKRQHQSGLGQEAQQAAVSRHIKSCDGALVGSFSEVESGRNNKRPQLHAALEMAKKEKATLIVAKLDRLGRKAWYMLRLIEESGVQFHFCNLPNADKLTIGIMAAMAEHEAEIISERIKAAFQAKRARGESCGGNPRFEDALKLGRAANRKLDKARQEGIKEIMSEIVTKGRITTHKGIADCLNARGIPTARGGKWHTTTVRRIIPMPVKEYAESLAA